MSSKINLQTCEYARKSSIFQDNQLILNKNKIVAKGIPDQILTKQLIQDVYKVDASIIEVSRRKVVIPEKLCCNC